MERIIFNNYDFNEEDIINSILEMNEELTREDITTEMICDEWYVQEDFWFEDEFSALIEFFKDKKIICFGSVGRWDGTFKGGEIFESFEDAYYRMTKDCDYVKIYEEDGHLYIQCSHHDGTNNFEIKILTEKGEDYYNNWEYMIFPNDARNEEYIHNQIIKRYSKIPRYCKSMWGQVQNKKVGAEFALTFFLLGIIKYLNINSSLILIFKYLIWQQTI